MLSDRDGSRLDGLQKALYDAWMEGATEAGGNPAGSPRAVLVRFVRGDERILAEPGGLVPSDAEVDRHSNGYAQFVLAAVEE